VKTSKLAPSANRENLAELCKACEHAFRTAVSAAALQIERDGVASPYLVAAVIDTEFKYTKAQRALADQG